MRDKCVCSRATIYYSLGNSAGAGTADDGRQALEIRLRLAVSRRAMARPGMPRKSPGSRNTASPVAQPRGAAEWASYGPSIEAVAENVGMRRTVFPPPYDPCTSYAIEGSGTRKALGQGLLALISKILTC